MVGSAGITARNNYVRIGRHHIFTNLYEYDAKFLRDVRDNHHVHIFITQWDPNYVNEDTIINLLSETITHTTYIKVVFYVVSSINQYDIIHMNVKRMISTIREKLSNCAFKIKDCIVNPNHRITFHNGICTDTHIAVTVYIGRNYVRAHSELLYQKYLSANSKMTMRSSEITLNKNYVKCDEDGNELNAATSASIDMNNNVIDLSKFTRENPEYVNKIVKWFRDNTPRSILRSFKSDKDIIRYLLDEAGSVRHSSAIHMPGIKDKDPVKIRESIKKALSELISTMGGKVDNHENV